MWWGNKMQMDTSLSTRGGLEAVYNTGGKLQWFKILNYLALKTCSSAVLSEHQVTEADRTCLPIRPDTGATLI